MDLLIIYGIEVLNAIAVLVVMSLGLAVVFGMMKIVNMANGEFMMLGGYSAILATKPLGIPSWR